MQKITILCVGKLKEKFYTEAVAESPTPPLPAKFRSKSMPEDPSPAQIAAALEKEAAAVRAKLPNSAFVVALCVEGTLRSSEDLARMLADSAGRGQSQVVFLIGSSFGLDPSLKSLAMERLSMSPMTFPHHLARVMLLEQVYRAYQINAGTKYHK